MDSYKKKMKQEQEKAAKMVCKNKYNSYILITVCTDEY